MSTPMNRFHSYGDDDNEEVEFEGWLQVSPQNNAVVVDSGNKCPRGTSVQRGCGNCPEPSATVCRKQCADNAHCQARAARSCGSRGCTNIIKRRPSIPCHCKPVEISQRDSEDVFYVNNKQHAPKILVQKPQTVIVRNHSRPPIVVQQPPPNVIVKNDPPKPIYVQSCPPNVVVKNERPSAVQKSPTLPMKYPQIVQTGYPPNYMKPCNCGRHNY